MVPEGWSKTSLEGEAKVIDCKHRTPPYVDEGIPVISPGTIKWGEIDLSSPVKRVTHQEYESLMDHCTIDKGDIVLSRNQSVGVASYINNPEPFVLGQDTVLVKPTYSDAKFLYYSLQSTPTQREIFKLAGGSTFSRINLKDIRKLKLLSPPPPEQSKIASILSIWDKAIETVEKLIENSLTEKKALMQQLLNGTKRLPGFGKPWREERFNKVFERVTQKNSIGNDNVLTISGQQGLVNQRDYFNKSVASDNLGGYTLLERGDFAYNKSYSKGYSMGAIKPLTKYDQGVVSSLYICFRLKDNKPSSQEFFRHYFEAGIFNREIYAIAQEGARNHGLLNLSVTDFFNAKLNIPEPDEKEAVEKVIRAAERELHNLEAQLESLQNQKKALMQQLLTGKRRVKVDAA